MSNERKFTIEYKTIFKVKGVLGLLIFEKMKKMGPFSTFNSSKCSYHVAQNS